MKKLLKYVLFFFGYCPIVLTAQVTEPNWIVNLTEEILNETDLCERCQWVNPTLSYVEIREEKYIFLRYSCSTSDSYARMYDLSGNKVGECLSINGVSDCGFGGNAFTIYTFADTILPIWNCEKGFDCTFALENGVEQKVPIRIDDSRCTEGIKILRASPEFITYEWQGENSTSSESSILIDQGGDYFLTVTDMDGCEFDGEITIPDIAKLDVKIKGANQICLGAETELKTTDFQSYAWSNGEMGASITANQAGEYSLTVTNDQDCQGTTSFLLENFPTLNSTIIAEPPTIKDGESVQLSVNNTTTDAFITAYEWTGVGRMDCDTCANITYFPPRTGTIQVTLMDNQGCLQSVSLLLEVVEQPLSVFAPNIFTPNSSNGNDKFTLFGGQNVESITEFSVFDRWGNQVFYQAGIPPNQTVFGWNGEYKGENAEQGVYLFQAVVVFTNGKKVMTSGELFLLRTKN